MRIELGSKFLEEALYSKQQRWKYSIFFTFLVIDLCWSCASFLHIFFLFYIKCLTWKLSIPFLYSNTYWVTWTFIFFFSCPCAWWCMYSIFLILPYYTWYRCSYCAKNLPTCLNIGSLCVKISLTWSFPLSYWITFILC